jgi:hypothetical protein
MAARLGLGHLLDDFEDSRQPSSLSLLGFAEFLWMDGWMDQPSLGAQGGVFMPLGSLGACSTLPCTRSSLGEKGTWFP